MTDRKRKLSDCGWKTWKLDLFFISNLSVLSFATVNNQSEIIKIMKMTFGIISETFVVWNKYRTSVEFLLKCDNYVDKRKLLMK